MAVSVSTGFILSVADKIHLSIKIGVYCAQALNSLIVRRTVPLEVQYVNQH